MNPVAGSITSDTAKTVYTWQAPGKFSYRFKGPFLIAVADAHRELISVHYKHNLLSFVRHLPSGQQIQFIRSISSNSLQPASDRKTPTHRNPVRQITLPNGTTIGFELFPGQTSLANQKTSFRAVITNAYQKDSELQNDGRKPGTQQKTTPATLELRDTSRAIDRALNNQTFY